MNFHFSTTQQGALNVKTAAWWQVLVKAAGDHCAYVSVPFIHNSCYLNLLSPHLRYVFCCFSSSSQSSSLPAASVDFQVLTAFHFSIPKLLVGSCGKKQNIIISVKWCEKAWSPVTRAHTSEREWWWTGFKIQGSKRQKIAKQNLLTETGMNTYNYPKWIVCVGIMSCYTAEFNRHARTDKQHIVCLHACPFTAAVSPRHTQKPNFLRGLLYAQGEVKQAGMSECK